MSSLYSTANASSFWCYSIIGIDNRLNVIRHVLVDLSGLTDAKVNFDNADVLLGMCCLI